MGCSAEKHYQLDEHTQNLSSYPVHSDSSNGYDTMDKCYQNLLSFPIDSDLSSRKAYIAS